MMNGAGAIIGSWLVLSITRTSISAAYVFLAVGLMQLAIAIYMYIRRARVPSGLYDEVLENTADVAAPS